MLDENISFAEVDGIKNFEYPVACTGICITPNQRRIITLGTYKPSTRVFDLGSLTMKFERHIVADPVATASLTEDGEKFAILRTDKCLEFHTRNGLHDLVRMPNQPKTVLFNPVASELYASGKYDSIYRFNLEQGRFLSEMAVPGVVDMGFSARHGLIGGVSEHNIFFIDSRSREPIISREYAETELLSIALHDDGITYAIGEADGAVSEFDIRSDEAMHKVSAKGTAAKLIYRGKHILCQALGQIVVCGSGQVEATINPGFTINDFDINGGLLALGGEYEEMKCYVSDALGPVPAWCSAAIL